MTSDLRDALDATARSATAGVDLGRLGTAARRRARRRLAGRSVLAAVVVLVLLALSSVVVPQLRPAPPASGHPSVGSHPSLVGWQWPVRALPGRPGPVAGLVDGAGRNAWYVVRADGFRWRLATFTGADQRPAVSADGRMLAYVDADRTTLVVRDLVTGHWLRLPHLGDASGAAGPYRFFPAQSPAYWSADDRYLAFGDVVLDAKTGQVRVRPGLGFPAGWLPDSRSLVTVEGTSVGPTGSAETTLTRVVVRWTTVDGTLLGRSQVAQLLPDLSWTTSSGTWQWSGAVSPDGRFLTLMPDGALTDTVVRRFDLATGDPAGPAVNFTGEAPACSIRMTSDRTLTVPIATRGTLRRVRVDLVSGHSRSLTRVDRTATSSPATCLELAEHAAAGPGHRPSLVPWLVARLAPHPGLLVVGGTLLLLVFAVLRARRPTPVRAAAPDDSRG